MINERYDELYQIVISSYIYVLRIVNFTYIHIYVCMSIYRDLGCKITRFDKVDPEETKSPGCHLMAPVRTEPKVQLGASL